MVEENSLKSEILNETLPERSWNMNHNEQDSNYAKFRMHRHKNPGLNISFLLFVIFPTIAMTNIYKGLLFLPVSDWTLRETSTIDIIKYCCWCGRVLPGWILILCQIIEFDLNAYLLKGLQRLNIPVFKNRFCWGDFVIVSFAFSMSVMLIAEASSCFSENKVCHSTKSQLTPMGMNISFYEIVLSQVVGATYLQVTLVGSSWIIIFSSWLIEFSSMVLSVYLSGSFKEIPIIIPIFLMSLFTTIEYENQLYGSFLSNLRYESLVLKALTEKNEKILAEVQRTEINFLVANTAHDMKTPLQAIGMGADDISGRLMQLPFRYAPSVPCVKESDAPFYILPCAEHDAILETVEIVTATVAFMSMTINRALDFSKVSNGILLAPSYETIDLEQVLAWPASIITSLQGNVSLSLSPLPVNICQNIITDKGWLTENLMCLISNAIKYSCGGSVVVCCYLREAAKLSNDTVAASIKATSVDDKGASSTIITSSITNKGQYLVVEVEDSGIGISLDKRHTLFSPFQRAQRMATGGTGLGLYSLRKRIESLGGECGIKDRDDGKQGTVVWFSFPYRPDRTRSLSVHSKSTRSCSYNSAESSVDGHSTPLDSAEESLSVLRRKAKLIGEATDRINRSPLDRMRYPTHSLSSKLGSGTKTPKSQNLSPNSKSQASTPVSQTSKSQLETSKISIVKPPHILIVDDSMSILKMCRRAMERAGYGVTVAENGFLALDILTQKHREFDVMLTDLQMPVMDGLELVKRFREIESGTDNLRSLLPIIGMSANSDDETRKSALEIGMDSFIAKPVNYITILFMIISVRLWYI
mmetsp:Transcript_26928/g.25788  ORF Transcript_26928/g.25788 Transcript_26928/m.25788 type:complete len:815 (-) Transcript_26928:30-2474(-)